MDIKWESQTTMVYCGSGTFFFFFLSHGSKMLLRRKQKHIVRLDQLFQTSPECIVNMHQKVTNHLADFQKGCVIMPLPRPLLSIMQYHKTVTSLPKGDVATWKHINTQLFSDQIQHSAQKQVYVTPYKTGMYSNGCHICNGYRSSTVFVGYILVHTQYLGSHIA